jgi:ElaB/YqjD/DUF883 family membrane-anchored ribosome-binding protein
MFNWFPKTAEIPRMGRFSRTLLFTTRGQLVRNYFQGGAFCCRRGGLLFLRAIVERGIDMSMQDQAEKAIDTAAGSARSTLNGVSDAVNGAHDQGERLAKNVARQTSQFAGQVSSSLKSAGLDTDKLAEQARGQARDLQSALIETIRSRPVGALAVAAGIGLFIGLMSSR